MMVLLNVLRNSIMGFVKDDCFSSGAAVAFYAVFSFPSLFVVIWTVGQVAGVSSERLGRIAESQAGFPLLKSFDSHSTLLQKEDSPNNADVDQSPQAETGKTRGAGTGENIVGIGILLFSATLVLAQLQYSLNRAWEVEPDPHQGGIKNFVFKRVVSLGLILVIAFLLLVSLVLSTMIDAIGAYLQGAAPTLVARAVGRTLNEIVAFLLAMGLFGTMYKVLPDVDMKWRDVLAGAAITALLSTVGRLVLSWYLRNSHVASGWDEAAKSVIVVLVWVYYSSLIVLFGAEITQAWVRRTGENAQPSKGAVRTVRKKEHKRDESDEGR